MQQREKGFDALFNEKDKGISDKESSKKLRTISLYIRNDYATKLRIISFYKRKGGVSKYLNYLIKKEIEKHNSIFDEVVKTYIDENKHEKKQLKELGIL